MQARHSPVVAPLALGALPPSMLRTASSTLSNNTPSMPRTPTCGSPVPFVLSNTNNNRKSRDSWNSWEDGDDIPHEFTEDHLLLLSRTLDALPAHLLTPFNGRPPAQLLDKVARGVGMAKGDDEWPHTVRQTRAKLQELARLKEQEATLDDRRRDGEAPSRENRSPQNNSDASRRPLYRQSSMDFTRGANGGPNNETIGRLSSRLQRADRAGFPYSRPADRPESPLVESRCLTSSPLNPRTPSKAAARSPVASRIPVHRTSTMTTSTVSSGMSVDDYNGAPLINPRVQHIRRSGSFSSMSAGSDSSSNRPPKRAPSYGKRTTESDSSSSANLSDMTKVESDYVFVQRHRKDSSSSTASSDEEEKARSKNAKKARRHDPTPPPPSLPCSPDVEPPKTKPFAVLRRKIEVGPLLAKALPQLPKAPESPRRAPAPPAPPTPSPAPAPTHAPQQQPPTRSRASMQRNPSFLGPELPHLIAASATGRQRFSGCPSSFRTQTPGGTSLLEPTSPTLVRKRERVTARATPPGALLAAAAVAAADAADADVNSSRRLRRVKGTVTNPPPQSRLAHAGPARRISFGSMAGATEDGAAPASTLDLGSAFQLQ